MSGPEVPENIHQKSEAISQEILVRILIGAICFMSGFYINYSINISNVQEAQEAQQEEALAEERITTETRLTAIETYLNNMIQGAQQRAETSRVSEERDTDIFEQTTGETTPSRR
jgi:hypothetical protein